MKPVGVLERQPAQEHGVDDCEARGVGADPQRQGGDRRRREPAIPCDHAPREPDVLQNRVDAGQTARRSMLFRERRHASQLQAGGAARGVGRQPAADIFIGEHRQVRCQLLVEVAVESIRRKERAQTGSRVHQSRPGGHPFLPSRSNSRPITPAMRSQLRVSATS